MISMITVVAVGEKMLGLAWIHACGFLIIAVFTVSAIALYIISETNKTIISFPEKLGLDAAMDDRQHTAVDCKRIH